MGSWEAINDVSIDSVFSLMLMGMPVPFAFGISGVTFFLQQPTLPLTMPVQQVLSQTQNFLCCNSIVHFSRNLLNETGITERVMKLASVITGHMLRDGTEQHGDSCIAGRDYELGDW